MKFAIIAKGKVWVVEDHDQPPIYAPYITVVDVTNVSPLPDVGWAYDGVSFTAPPTPVAPTPPPPDVEVVHPNSLKVGTFIMYILNIASPGMPAHTNPYTHFLDLRRGKLTVTDAGVDTTYTAPAIIMLPKGNVHSWVAAADGTIVYNLHP